MRGSHLNIHFFIYRIAICHAYALDATICHLTVKDRAKFTSYLFIDFLPYKHRDDRTFAISTKKSPRVVRELSVFTEA